MFTYIEIADTQFAGAHDGCLEKQLEFIPRIGECVSHHVNEPLRRGNFRSHTARVIDIDWVLPEEGDSYGGKGFVTIYCELIWEPV